MWRQYSLLAWCSYCCLQWNTSIKLIIQSSLLTKRMIKILNVIFIRNIHDSHNARTPQYDLLQVLTLVHGICSSCQNSYLWFECNANSTDFRSRIFSILRLDWHQRFSQQYNNRTVLYWLPFVDKINRRYIWISDDGLWK